MLAGVGYVDGGLCLVAGEDPDLDAAAPERLQRQRHVLLQLVLDGRRPDQRHAGLDELEGLPDQPVPRHDVIVGAVEHLLDRRVVSLRQLLVGQGQCAPALLTEATMTKCRRVYFAAKQGTQTQRCVMPFEQLKSN